MSHKNIVIFERSQILGEGLRTIIEEDTNFIVTNNFHTSEEPFSFPVEDTDLVIVDPRFFSEFTLAKNVHEWRDLKNTLPIMACYSCYVSSQFENLFDSSIGLDDDPNEIIKKIHNLTDSDDEHLSGENGELTHREKNILILVVKGFTNKEIGDRLNISPHTVISHRKNIVKKTNIRSLSGLTMYALLNNLITQKDIR